MFRYGEMVLVNFNQQKAGFSVSQRGADRAGGVKPDAVPPGMVTGMRMSGEDGRYAVFLEKVQVLHALCKGEVEVVFGFIGAFTEYGTVQENEDEAAAAGFLQPGREPFFLLGLLFFRADDDGVAVQADEAASFLPKEKSSAAFGVVVAGKLVYGSLQLSGVVAVDGALEGIGRVIYQVSGDDDCGRFQGIGFGYGPLQQGICFLIPGGGVDKPYLGVCHLDEAELPGRETGGCQYDPC